jgi:hypothetical protein
VRRSRRCIESTLSRGFCALAHVRARLGTKLDSYLTEEKEILPSGRAESMDRDGAHRTRPQARHFSGRKRIRQLAERAFRRGFQRRCTPQRACAASMHTLTVDWTYEPRLLGH